MRRHAVDRLLVHYLELSEDEQADFLADCRRRYPRLYRWLDRLVEGGHTVTLLDDSVRKLAGDAVQSRSEGEQRTELVPGTEIGPWRIVEEIGRGGMGMVYRGERSDGAFEMDVAIKLIGRRKRGLAELLQRECRLLARLDHPAVTRLVDAGLDDRAGPFLVMEWVDGTDLDEWIEVENPSLEQRLELFDQLVEATGHAHQRLIVHGDIKPANVRVRSDGSVKLMDFGVSRLLDSDDVDHAGIRALTPSFAPPEQLQGEEITPKGDIWSLGALLFWLLTGEVLRDHSRDSVGAQVGRRYRRGRELAAIIDKACAETPEHRYPTAPELAADLVRFRSHQPVSAMPPDRSYRMARFARRNPVLIGGMVATFLALAIGLATTTLMYSEADQARMEALHERDRAERHAQELERVAAFQEMQLADIDAATMGAGIRGRLLSQHHSVLTQLTLNDEEIQVRRQAFSDELGLFNFTDLALSTLDTDLFERSRVAIDEQFSEQPEVRARLLQTLASTLREIGLLDAAVEPQQLALEIRSEQLGKDDPATLDSMKQMAALQLAMGNPAEGLLLFESNLALQREVLGETHPDTLETINAIGSAYFHLGNMEKAERKYRMALTARRQLLGDNHPDTIFSLICLGAALRFTGQADEALETLNSAAETSRHILGETHEHSMLALSQLGMVTGEQGHFDLAERHFRELLAIQSVQLGSRHPDTLATKRVLGTVLHRSGNLEEARTYLRKTLDGRRAVLGNTNRRTGRAIDFLARLLLDMGELEEAEAHFAELLELRHITRGEDHPLTLRTFLTLAHTRSELGQIDSALELTDHGLRVARTTLPEDHELTARMALLHGQLLAETRQFQDAADTLQAAYHTFEKEPEQNRERLLIIERALAELYESWHQEAPGAGHGSAASHWRAMHEDSDYQ
jgi:eukaryotic-like serine/threonine-protein kinase